jgi:hypothetical protein
MAGVRRRRSQVHISVKSTGNGPLSIDGVSSPCPAGQTLLWLCSILALEVPPQTIEQVQDLSLAINCPAAYHGLKIIICCREAQLKESPNCLSISMEVLVFQHLIPHATLNDMTRTPVPEAKDRKDPWNTRRRVCQPSPSPANVSSGHHQYSKL